MKCRSCGVQKLSNEFPPWTIMEECRHAPLHCLRCVVAHVEEHGECSQCDVTVGEDSIRLKRCYSQLEAMFPECKLNYVPKAEGAPTLSGKGFISLAMLNGDSASLQLNSGMTVSTLKVYVKSKLQVPLENQQLIYNGTELKEFTDAKAAATLGYYQVQPTSTIHVRRLLYSAPKDLDKVVFDLNWGYPSRRRDFLDASVLIFERHKYVGVLDYRHTSFPPAMRHSGDLMNDRNRTGHHFINVDLHKIPANITHFFFTLSAWNSPTVSRYPNPSLRFYKQSEPGKMLCEDTITKLNYSQAIVMAWMTRQGGHWCVFSAGKPSAGNAKNYKCLVSTIQGIISNGV
ncbi:uncharacterized protein [Asterias amurensis]|uniref:uncharacterized protein n=1 Tax=Asterias amurensis TaxID=7602 RepID=UPI003AB8615C